MAVIPGVIGQDPTVQHGVVPFSLTIMGFPPVVPAYLVGVVLLSAVVDGLTSIALSVDGVGAISQAVAGVAALSIAVDDEVLIGDRAVQGTVRLNLVEV